MSLIKSIKNIEPEFIINKDLGSVVARVTYNGVFYCEQAQVHPDDKEYFATYTGCTIALSRLKIEIFKNELSKVSQELKVKEQMVHEVTCHSFNRNIDPTGGFYWNLIKCRKRKNALQNALKREKAELNLYLKLQDETIKRLKQMKEQGKIK